MAIKALLYSRGIKAIGERNEEYCFDILARRRNDLLVIKVVNDANKITPTAAQGMKRISKFFGALPIIIANEIDGSEIEDDIVYSKFNIPVLNEETFEKMLRENAPLIYVTKGGIYVKLNSSKLRKSREALGLTRGDFARLLGTSRKTIINYEHGLYDATIFVAAKIEEIIGIEVFEKLSIKSLKKHFISQKIKQKNIYYQNRFRNKNLSIFTSILRELGFSSISFLKTPFKAGAKLENRKFKLVIDLEDKEIITREREEMLVDVAEITCSKAILITKREKKDLDEENIITISEESLKNPYKVKRMIWEEFTFSDQK